MTNITLFGIYPKLIIRLSLLNLTRLKYHKKYIWQFRKSKQGKGEMNIWKDKWFDLHKQVFVKAPPFSTAWIALSSCSRSHSVAHNHRNCAFYPKCCPCWRQEAFAGSTQWCCGTVWRGDHGRAGWGSSREVPDPMSRDPDPVAPATGTAPATPLFRGRLCLTST